MPAGKVLSVTTALLLQLLMAAAAAVPATAGAETTRIPVHVLSQDAKLIGSGVGGAWVTVTDAATGEVLAQGAHAGATGDTQKIMRLDPQERDTVLFDTEGAAVFVAEFDIDEPTVVRISAAGPLGNPDASMRATTEMLVTPGAEITGDGVVLTLHGLNIDSKVVGMGKLGYAGEASRFAGEVTPAEPGAYVLEIIGEQPSKANFGRARMPLAVD